MDPKIMKKNFRFNIFKAENSNNLCSRLKNKPNYPNFSRVNPGTASTTTPAPFLYKRLYF